MNQTEKINFRQTRDFGEIFNITVQFLKQNFKSFFSAIILIAGPFLLISSIAGGVYQSSALGLRAMALTGSYDFLEQYGITFIIFIFFSILSHLVSVGTTFAFIILYMEKGPGNFTTSDVSRLLVKNAGRLLLTFFAILLLLIPFFAILVAIGVALTLSKAVALIILFFFALFIGMAIFFPNLFWSLSAVYLVAMQEEKPIFSSIGRTFQVMRGSYWWTWLIMLCALIAIYVIAMIFSLPQIIYQLMLTFSHYGATEEGSGMSIPFIAVATICTFLTTVLYSVMYILCGFHYHSLAEKKDGIGLMNRIDEIGNTPDSNVEQQY